MMLDTGPVVLGCSMWQCGMLAGHEGECFKGLRLRTTEHIIVTELGRERLIRALELAHVHGQTCKREKGVLVSSHALALDIADQLLAGEIRASSQGGGIQGELRGVAKWVVVGVWWPEHGQCVLVFDEPAKRVRVVMFVKGDEDGWPKFGITHWQPLPELPQEQS